MVEKYWKQFERSGKVEDYLSFSQKRQETDYIEQVKQGEHAGIHLCDGNHTETDTLRGVRQTYQPFD